MCPYARAHAHQCSGARGFDFGKNALEVDASRFYRAKDSGGGRWAPRRRPLSSRAEGCVHHFPVVFELVEPDPCKAVIDLPSLLVNPSEFSEVRSPSEAAEPIAPVAVFVEPGALHLDPAHGFASRAWPLPRGEIAPGSVATRRCPGIAVLKPCPEGRALGDRPSVEKRPDLEDKLPLIVFGRIRGLPNGDSFHLVESVQGNGVQVFEFKSHHAWFPSSDVRRAGGLGPTSQVFVETAS